MKGMADDEAKIMVCVCVPTCVWSVLAPVLLNVVLLDVCESEDLLAVRLSTQAPRANSRKKLQVLGLIISSRRSASRVKGAIAALDVVSIDGSMGRVGVSIEVGVSRRS